MDTPDIRKVLIITGLVLVLFIGSSYALLAHRVTKPKNDGASYDNSANAPSNSNQYSYLADDCQKGVANEKLLASGMESQAKSITDTAAADAASYKAQIAANDAEYAAQPHGDGYFESSNYNAGVTAANDSAAQQKETLVLQTARAQVNAISAKEKTVIDRENQLIACMNSVNNNEELTSDQVTNYEALVGQSSLSPY